MTQQEIIALLYSINDLYPHLKTTPEQAKNRAALWYTELKDYDTKEVVQAVKLHLSKSSFYPLPADVIKMLPRARIVIDMAEGKALESGQKLISTSKEDATKIVERVLTDLYGKEVLTQ